MFAADRDERWLYGAAILLGVWLRVARFWEPSLWLDELSTAWVVSADGWQAFWQRCLLAHQPPVYFGLVKLAMLFGRNEFFLRLPTVLLGLAALGMVMYLMGRLAGQRGMLYAGAVFALNAKVIYHGQEARPYALMFFATAASIHFFVAWMDHGGRRRLAAYTAATLLACYSHVIYVVVLLGQILVALWLRPPGLRQLLGAQAVVLALLAPLAPLAASIGTTRAGLAGFIPLPTLDGLLKRMTWPETALAVGLTLVALPRLWVCGRRLAKLTTGERGLVALAGVYLAMLPAAALLAMAGVVNILASRYMLLPLVGAILLGTFVAAKAQDRLVRLCLWTFVLLSAVLHVTIAVRIGPLLGTSKEDWRSAIRWMAEQYRPGDVVLIQSGLIEAKYLSPEEPGVNEYLALPLCGFYDRGGMTVYNLPWYAHDLATTPLLPAAARELAARAPQVFAIMPVWPPGWDTALQERLFQVGGRPARTVEVRKFEGVEVQVYRLAAMPATSNAVAAGISSGQEGYRK